MIHQRYKDLAFTASLYVTRLLSPLYRLRYSGSTGLKLHLGASHNLIDGFINIDGNPLRKGNLYFDIRNKLPFKDGSVDTLFSCNVFEHFYPDEIIKVIKDVHRVLKKDGIIRIVVPDLEKAVEAYNKGDNNFFRDFPRQHNSKGGRFSNHILCDAQHKIIYDFSYLSEIMVSCGFNEKNIFRTEFNKSRINQEIYNRIKPFEEHFAVTDLFVEAVK